MNVERTVTEIDRTLVLWRGEAPEREHALKTRGLPLEERWGSSAPLWAMYPGLTNRNLGAVLESAVELVRGHILQEEATPFYSWTRNPEAAKRYALTHFAGGREVPRSTGLLLRVSVHLVAEYQETLHTTDGSVPVKIQFDERGRLWVAAWRFVNATSALAPDPDFIDEVTGEAEEPIVNPSDRGEFEALFQGGNDGLIQYRAGRDEEYVVAGGIEPTEFTCVGIRGVPGPEWRR